jgi:hypothetical protein
MLKRVLDAYNSLNESDEMLTLALFDEIGAIALLNLDIRERLVRENFQLVQEKS